PDFGLGAGWRETALAYLLEIQPVFFLYDTLYQPLAACWETGTVVFFGIVRTIAYLVLSPLRMFRLAVVFTLETPVLASGTAAVSTAASAGAAWDGTPSPTSSSDAAIKAAKNRGRRIRIA